MRKNPVVYVVFGPDPTWGDGLGVVGYAASYKAALAIVRELREEEREYGPRSWRSADDCTVEPFPAWELGWDGREPIHRLVDRLNLAIG